MRSSRLGRVVDTWCLWEFESKVRACRGEVRSWASARRYSLVIFERLLDARGRRVAAVLGLCAFVLRFQYRLVQCFEVSV